MELNNNFPRTLSLLRRERNISQRVAAADMGRVGEVIGGRCDGVLAAQLAQQVEEHIQGVDQLTTKTGDFFAFFSLQIVIRSI